jgi:hypothetical protein
MRTLRQSACVAVLLLLGIAPALAQAPGGPPVRVRGTVEKLDGQTLMVKSRTGEDVKVALAPNYMVRAVLKRSLSDIKPGDFVASTSVKGTDGKLHAIEVHIFVDAQRGVVPELQSPWDLVPDSVMTNAIVSGIAEAPKGRTLKVTYKGNETEVIVPEDIPIVTYGPGDASLLKPGAAVFIIAQKKEDGSLSSAQVTAEKDGVKPPM